MEKDIGSLEIRIATLERQVQELLKSKPTISEIAEQTREVFKMVRWGETSSIGFQSGLESIRDIH